MNHSFNITIAERYGIDEAILIELIFWWLHKNECEELEDMFHDGRMWCRSTAKGFAKYVPYMSWQKINRLLRSLEKRGVLMVGNFNSKATNQTLWYSFKDSFKIIMKEVGYDFSKMKIGTFKNENSNINTTSSINKDNNILVNKEKYLSNDKLKSADGDLEFNEFYKLYPLKKGKPCAERAWKKLSAKDRQAAIDKLQAYIADCVTNKRSFKYPATYLNQRTWEDDFGTKQQVSFYDSMPTDSDEERRYKAYMRLNHPEIENTALPLSYKDYMLRVDDVGVDTLESLLNDIEGEIWKYRKSDIDAVLRQKIKESGVQ